PACSGWTPRSVRSCRGSRPTWPSSRSRGRRSTPSKIPLRPWFWAGRPIGLQLLSYTARTATDEGRVHGPIREEPPEEHEAACCRSAAAARLDGAVDRGHHVLPPATPPREVDVRAPRARLRPRLRRNGDRRHLPGPGRDELRAVRVRRAEAGSREPEERPGLARPLDGVPDG